MFRSLAIGSLIAASCALPAFAEHDGYGSGCQGGELAGGPVVDCGYSSGYTTYSAPATTYTYEQAPAVTYTPAPRTYSHGYSTSSTLRTYTQTQAPFVPQVYSSTHSPQQYTYSQTGTHGTTYAPNYCCERPQVTYYQPAPTQYSAPVTYSQSSQTSYYTAPQSTVTYYTEPTYSAPAPVQYQPAPRVTYYTIHTDRAEPYAHYDRHWKRHTSSSRRY